MFDHIKISAIRVYYYILKVKYENELKILFDLDKSIKKNIAIYIRKFTRPDTVIKKLYFIKL